MELIDKAVVVEEIKKLQKQYSEAPTRNTYEKGLKEGRLIGYKDALHKLDTLEVKEVDLDKEIDNIWNPRFNLGWDEKSLLSMNHEGFTTIAKHFFELGLKAQKGE